MERKKRKQERKHERQGLGPPFKKMIKKFKFKFKIQLEFPMRGYRVVLVSLFTYGVPVSSYHHVNHYYTSHLILLVLGSASIYIIMNIYHHEFIPS